MRPGSCVLGLLELLVQLVQGVMRPRRWLLEMLLQGVIRTGSRFRS